MKTGLLALALVGALIIVTRRAPVVSDTPKSAVAIPPPTTVASRDLTAPGLKCWFSAGRDKHYVNGVWDGTYYLNSNGDHGVVFTSGSSAVISYGGRTFWIDNYDLATCVLPDRTGKPVTLLHGWFIKRGMRPYNGTDISVWEFSP